VTDLRLSNSEMSTFRRCERKWWLSQYRRLQSVNPQKPGSALSIGNLVHDALANFYDPEVKADPVAFVDQHLTARLAADPMHEDELMKENNLVHIMLGGYVEWLAETGADEDIQVTGTERMVEVPLVDGVNLLSKLDAPVERISDGAKLAFEHKTTGDLDGPLNKLKLDTQLLTEHLARFLDAIEKGATPEEAYDQCHGILYNQLKKVKRTAAAKPPFYARTDITHNIHELRNHWKHVLVIARKIQDRRTRLDAGESHHTVCEPNPTNDCTWDCSFFKICVLFDDGSDVEGAIAAMYIEGDPLERYADTLKL
jgi:hypothetical protein